MKHTADGRIFRIREEGVTWSSYVCSWCAWSKLYYVEHRWCDSSTNSPSGAPYVSRLNPWSVLKRRPPCQRDEPSLSPSCTKIHAYSRVGFMLPFMQQPIPRLGWFRYQIAKPSTSALPAVSRHAHHLMPCLILVSDKGKKSMLNDHMYICAKIVPCGNQTHPLNLLKQQRPYWSGLQVMSRMDGWH